MPDTFVLVHGGWHTGAELEPAAEHIRRAGHQVHCPTLAGNRPGDDRSRIGLQDAVDSLVAYVVAHDLRHIRLVGHSYGGMVITAASELIAERIQRLVYVNAFVPQPGESLNDLVPPAYVELFGKLAAESGGSVMLPFPIWREAFMNDADLAMATAAYRKLNPHPYKTLADKVKLKAPMAASPLAKSYVNCQQDTALPRSLPWHPRLSERLGLFRLVECPGGHELWFTGPETIADAVMRAGRD